MANRLANAASPYLRQHAENPVDWYPWGDEAFSRSREEDKPIFLSVGYSSCHWCHVMAHESFEDSSIGDFLNEHFVSIKLDREERPDVDEVYMTAVQLATGRGGWPMSLFLTPDRKPFFAGTYFPREDRGQYPGFRTLLRQVAEGWRNHRGQLETAAQEFAVGLEEALGRVASPDGAVLGPALFAHALDALHGDFDPDHGGFGNKPKFPPHTALRFQLRLAASPLASEVDILLPGAAEMARDMATKTLDKIALGGIHDHVGGGFHRYSTDEHWLLPHFEKMLYDNAQLLETYTMAGQYSPASGIVEWIRQEMTASNGVFYSALDADSDGEEGLYYTWTLAEVRDVLGLDLEFETSFGLTNEGNFEDEAAGKRTGKNVLYRKDFRGDYADSLKLLAAARKARVRPQLDDKAVASWNGLAIAALASSDRELAERAALRWAACKTLPHMIVGEQEIGRAFLDDIAHMGLGFAALGWHEKAGALADRILSEFRDPQGGFWFTSAEHESLIGRSKPAIDGSMPSGNAAAIRLLMECGRMDEAHDALTSMLGWMERVPAGTEALLDAALLWLERSGLAAADQPNVRVTLVPDIATPDEDGVVRAEVQLDLPTGWHLQQPTELESTAPQFAVVHSSDTHTSISCKPQSKSVEILVQWQVCNDSVCLPPQSKTLVLRIV